MADTKKRIKFVSPKGIFRFPKIDAPDYGNDKYPKPDGEYSVQLVLSQDDPATKAFLAKLAPYQKQAVENGEEEFKKLKVESRKKLGSISVNELYTVQYDQETEEPTGDIVIKFAMKAGGTTKKGKVWSQKPAVFDAKGKLLTKVPSIWGGTVGKVSFEITEGGYFIPGTGAVGLSKSLLGVQIIDLVSGGQRTAKDLGFGEEDGYTHEDEAETNGFGDETGEDSSDATSEDGDF